jgi:hydroxymethylbilane synthase
MIADASERDTVIETLCLGTRASALARWQTEYIREQLQNAWPEVEIRTQVITTRGDQTLDAPLPLIGGKGVFTAELESALHRREIDFAIHSLKDLPTENPDGLTIGAIPARAHPGDALISRGGHTFKTLSYGAVVGTSSRRRAAQLLYRRPDLRIVDIRGNVDTRVRKALDPEGSYDAIVLALAGLERLGKTQVISERLSMEDMLPAPGQGALAVQCRDESESLSWVKPLNHDPTAAAVTAERAFLAALGGGCSLPVGAYAEIKEGGLVLRGRVTALDGSQQVDVSLNGAADSLSASKLGTELAQIALDKGVARLLENLS